MTAKTYPPIILGFFARGLNTNRQPLFSALTGVGLQVVQFKDYLVDGINVECSDKFTLQRAPGFTKYCTAQLAVSEKVNQFYSTRDLSGNVYPLADTNQKLYKVTPSALTSLLTKGTTAQGYIQQIGEVTYYANGTDLKKWFPPAAGMVPWGVAAPISKPAVAPGLGNPNAFWTPSYSFLANAGILDSNGNVQYSFNATAISNSYGIPAWSTILGATTFDGAIFWENAGPVGSWAASTVFTKPTMIADTNGNLQLVATPGTSGATAPAWSTGFNTGTADNTITWRNVGPATIAAYSGFGYVFAYRTVSGHLSTASPPTVTGPVLSSVPISPIAITAWSITANVVTFTCNNTLTAGAYVQLSGFGTSTFFNGTKAIVSASGLSTTQFKAPFVHADGSATEAGTGSPVVAIVQGASINNPECNSVATITSVQVVAGLATITAANNYTPGINVLFSGVTGAIFLNGQTLQVTSATPTSFTVRVSPLSYGPTVQSGVATFLSVEVYRTADGGGVFYYDGACENGGTWIFYDTASDGNLTTQLVAPLANQNDPPPGSSGSTGSSGGTRGSTVTTGGTILAWWSNRIWMAVGNLLYFSGGPDILNGIPEECWPPGNVFVFPGVIGSLNATTGGLVVTVPDEVWAIVGGPQTVAYYPERILSRFGALSANCVAQDGDTLYVYNSQKQLVVLSGAGKAELGSGGSGISPVGDVLANGASTSIVVASAWSPTASYITVHRQGEDSGVYLSNGVESIIRYGLNVGNFSPIRQPLVTGGVTPHAGALNSVETSAGQYSLLFNPNATHDYIYKRDLAAYADNATAYASSAVIGNIVVTEPGQPLAPLQFIVAYLYNRGSVPAVSFFPNDITPASFLALPTVQPEPAFLPAPVNLISKRWPVIMNSSGTPILVRHLQVKIDFGNTDTAKNELIELALRFDNEQLL